MKILGHDYTVRNDPRMLTDSDAIGQCCARGLWIRLDSSAPTSRYEEALLHEILEAVKYHLGLDIDHAILTALSEALYAALEDNGMKTAWLPDEEGDEECQQS